MPILGSRADLQGLRHRETAWAKATVRQEVVKWAFYWTNFDRDVSYHPGSVFKKSRVFYS